MAATGLSDEREADQQARAHDADMAAAASHLAKALALAPRDPDVVGHAAVLLQSRGRLDDAIGLHEFSVARDPLDGPGLFNLGLAYHFAGRLEAADAAFRRLLRLAPEYRGARYRLGTVALRQHRFDAALAGFEREPDRAFRVKGRTLALLALGRRREADQELERLMPLYENLHDDARWPAFLERVNASDRQLQRIAFSAPVAQIVLADRE